MEHHLKNILTILLQNQKQIHSVPAHALTSTPTKPVMETSQPCLPNFNSRDTYWLTKILCWVLGDNMTPCLHPRGSQSRRQKCEEINYRWCQVQQGSEAAEWRKDELSGVQGSGREVLLWESSAKEVTVPGRYKFREKRKERDRYMRLHGKRAWDFRSVLTGKEKSQ